jgi:hypothetical protein
LGLAKWVSFSWSLPSACALASWRLPGRQLAAAGVRALDLVGMAPPHEHLPRKRTCSGAH